MGKIQVSEKQARQMLDMSQSSAAQLRQEDIESYICNWKSRGLIKQSPLEEARKEAEGVSSGKSGKSMCSDAMSDLVHIDDYNSIVYAYEKAIEELSDDSRNNK